MLKDIVRGECVTKEEYRLMYLTNGSGFSFPCDKYGNALPLENECAKMNLEWCKEHSEEFDESGVVKYYKTSWREPDKGTCDCGETVILENQYMGACECPNCGRWYNLFGQSILPPDEWDMSDDEYY